MTPKVDPQCEVLSIGAGPEQLHGIQIAMKLGLKVLAFDGDPNAPGLKIAECGLAIDPIDTAQVINLAKKAKIKALIPVPLGHLLITAGAVNDALELKGINERAARLCTDKLAMREVLSHANLSQPKWLVASTIVGIDKAAHLLGYPLVIKPRAGSSSRGVLLVRNRDQLLSLLDWHLSFGRNNPFLSDTLCESVLEGTEFGFDGAVIDKQLIPLSLRAKEMGPEPYRVALGYRGPISLGQTADISLFEVLGRACMALGLSDCLVHADLMINDMGQTSIIELSGRPSGLGLSQILLPATIGIQPTEQMLRYLLGMEYSFARTQNKVGMLRFLDFKPSQLNTSFNSSHIKRPPGLIELLYKEGSRERYNQHRTGQSAYSAGLAIFAGDTFETIEESWQQLKNAGTKEK